VDFCIEHGVNLLSVKKLIEYSPDMRAFILNEEQNAALPDYVEKAIIRARGTRLTHNLDSLLPLQKEKERMPGSDGSENGKSVAAMPITSVWCLEPWRGLVVSSSGHVAPCCFFWDGEADSIRDKSLEEVWLGPYMTAFRAGMREGKLTGDCRKCGFPNSKDHRQLVECVKQAARTNGAWPGRGSVLWSRHGTACAETVCVKASNDSGNGALFVVPYAMSPNSPIKALTALSDS